MWIKLKNLPSLEMQIAYTSCAVYVPPESSLYFSDEIFHDLNTEISSLAKSKIPVILCGDFNARTGNTLDYIPHTGDKHVSNLF